jgi:hypothetical protein
LQVTDFVRPRFRKIGFSHNLALHLTAPRVARAGGVLRYACSRHRTKAYGEASCLGGRIVARIFLNYRREDSRADAGRLYDHLSRHFGPDNIFMDIDNIPPSYDFVEVIENAVESSGVLLAVLGRQWLTCTDPQGHRRLDNPEDYVRLEIVTALERRIPIIPVLVGGASMPRSTELPDVLQPFARCQAFVVGDRFQPDVDCLIATLEQEHGVKVSKASSGTQAMEAYHRILERAANGQFQDRVEEQSEPDFCYIQELYTGGYLTGHNVSSLDHPKGGAYIGLRITPNGRAYLWQLAVPGLEAEPSKFEAK